MALSTWPLCSDGRRQISWAVELAAERSVSSNKIGVAKTADCFGPIILSTAPQIAPREATEDSGASRANTLTLQGVENLLDDVRQTAPAGPGYDAGSVAPASLNPFSRR